MTDCYFQPLVTQINSNAMCINTEVLTQVKFTLKFLERVGSPIMDVSVIKDSKL